MQGELGNGQNLSANVLDRQVHLALIIGKNPHIDNLPDRVVHIFLTIIRPDTYQEQETLFNAAMQLLVNTDLSTFDTLNDNFHIFSFISDYYLL